MKYICGICGKIYDDYNTPIITKSGVVGDGCCKIGSLIELGAIYAFALQRGYITLKDYIEKYKIGNNQHHPRTETIYVPSPYVKTIKS